MQIAFEFYQHNRDTLVSLNLVTMLIKLQNAQRMQYTRQTFLW